MRPRDLAGFVLLGAIWGGAFPLMRIATPAFGPVPLVTVRVGVATIVLVALAGGFGGLRRGARSLFVLGLVNTAVPFALFSYATLSVTAGLASLLNATTPMFGALVAHLWLGERLTRLRLTGILLGFVGVAAIVWDSVGARADGAALGVAAGLAGALCYGIAASYARRHLESLDALTVAAGSVCGAAVALLPLAILQWPAQTPGPGAWAAAVALGLGCTALAYLIYFRLLGRIGASRALTVTFLIPLFGILWGAIFLDEPVTVALLLGGTLVLAGTSLATGLVR